MGNMAHHISWFANNKCFVVTWSGDIDLTAAKQYLSDIINHPDFSARRGVLHDMREASVSMSYDDAIDLLTIYDVEIRKTRAGVESSILVKTPYQFGVVRQFLARFDLEDEVWVTYDEAEAKDRMGFGNNGSSILN